MVISRSLLLCAAFSLATAVARATPAPAGLQTAETDLLQGRADKAVAELRTLVASASGNAPAHLLLCRAFLSTLQAAPAADECRAALNDGLGNSAAAQDWAGRAFGMKAQHAGPISGLHLAGDVRNAFQAAYRLDPKDPAGANDLGEFYIAAPGIVGGGVDKARALADTLQSSLPEVAHRLRALIAEKQGDPAGAEREFMAATEVRQSPDAYVDLGNFYVRHGAPEKAITAAQRAISLDHDVDANVVDAAVCLRDAHAPAQAIPVLRAYLEHGKQSDAAPAFRVHTLLGQMLSARGDKAGAKAEFTAALALASGYAPAQKGLNSL